MSKRALKLYVRIPNFESDVLAWRRKIYDAIVKVQQGSSVKYDENDKLEVEICLYLVPYKLTTLDLDNRAKTILDALQGFMRDKGKNGLPCIIPNDNQIYRLIVEKRLPPKGNVAAFSRIEIRGYDHHARTAGSTRTTRKLPARSNKRLQRTPR
jgi:Holliday junction resolvase RusA-like endonuclease